MPLRTRPRNPEPEELLRYRSKEMDAARGIPNKLLWSGREVRPVLVAVSCDSGPITTNEPGGKEDEALSGHGSPTAQALTLRDGFQPIGGSPSLANQR